jgi:hypothetical protein
LVIQLDGIGTLNADAGSVKAKKITTNYEHIYSIRDSVNSNINSMPGLAEGPKELILLMAHEND